MENNIGAMFWALGMFIAVKSVTIRVLLFLGPPSGQSFIHAYIFWHLFLNLCMVKTMSSYQNIHF